MPTADLLIAGIRVRIESDRTGDPLDALLADWSATAAGSDHEPDIRIALHPRSWDEGSPLRLPADARLLRMGGRKVFTDGRRHFIDFHENAFFRIGEGEAEGVCYTHPGLDPIFWTELSVNHVLLLLLRQKGRFFLHGGGAVNPEGRAVIFTGPGGSGKSTSSLALLAAGWPWLGDDLVFFDSDLRFHAFPKRASAEDWTVERLGLESRVIGARATGKRLLDAERVASGSYEARILHPLPSASGRNMLGPMAPGEALRLLVSQSRLCETDERIAGPLPDLAPLASAMLEIEIGDLAGLADFLGRT